MDGLKTLRDGIDDIDKEILALFMKRMELCKGVADYKKANNRPVFQKTARLRSLRLLWT